MNEHRSEALTEHEVAHRLGLSVATLRAWRGKRKGPRFVRFGRAVRYLSADIDWYVQANAVNPQIEGPARDGSLVDAESIS